MAENYIRSVGPTINNVQVESSGNWREWQVPFGPNGFNSGRQFCTKPRARILPPGSDGAFYSGYLADSSDYEFGTDLSTNSEAQIVVAGLHGGSGFEANITVVGFDSDLGFGFTVTDEPYVPTPMVQQTDID